MKNWMCQMFLCNPLVPAGVPFRVQSRPLWVKV